MISRLLFAVCLGWFLLVVGVTGAGWTNYPHAITEGELVFTLALATSPVFLIAGVVRLVRWIIQG